MRNLRMPSFYHNPEGLVTARPLSITSMACLLCVACVPTLPPSNLKAPFSRWAGPRTSMYRRLCYSFRLVDVSYRLASALRFDALVSYIDRDLSGTCGLMLARDIRPIASKFAKTTSFASTLLAGACISMSSRTR
jgi:hypothetical protein